MTPEPKRYFFFPLPLRLHTTLSPARSVAGWVQMSEGRFKGHECVEFNGNASNIMTAVIDEHIFMQVCPPPDLAFAFALYLSFFLSCCAHKLALARCCVVCSPTRSNSPSKSRTSSRIRLSRSCSTPPLREHRSGYHRSPPPSPTVH